MGKALPVIELKPKGPLLSLRLLDEELKAPLFALILSLL
jgi:hypothetical protein